MNACKCWSEGGAVRRVTLLLPKLVHKTLCKADTIEPEVKEVAAGGDEGVAGYMPGYVPTGDDRQIQEVYGCRVNSNNISHLIGGITDY